ncbi:MAG: divisome protein SepX/GlpR [Marmoricola sp.]
MDLSGVIFVALALAWAVYLIPKALQQHDELARTRSVESFSSRLRVLGARGRAGDDVVVEEDVAVAAVAETVVRVPALTRAAARGAAARRRRVLAVLTVLLVATVALAAFSVVGWWAVAIPAAMIVLFLLVARLSVRRQQARFAAPAVTASRAPAPVESVEDDDSEDSEDSEDTVGVARADLAAAGLGEQPLADEGSLWDPLPVTLPTYVTKPAARRTVRTIELTRREVTSSGHDAADTALVRDATATKGSAEDAGVAEVTEQRRAAGA